MSLVCVETRGLTEKSRACHQCQIPPTHACQKQLTLNSSTFQDKCKNKQQTITLDLGREGQGSYALHFYFVYFPT